MNGRERERRCWWRGAQVLCRIGVLGACGVGRRGALAKAGTVFVRQLFPPRGMGLSGEVGGMTARVWLVSASPLMLFDEMTISIVRLFESCESDLRSTVGGLPLLAWSPPLSCQNNVETGV